MYTQYLIKSADACVKNTLVEVKALIQILCSSKSKGSEIYLSILH